MGSKEVSSENQVISSLQGFSEKLLKSLQSSDEQSIQASLDMVVKLVNLFSASNSQHKLSEFLPVDFEQHIPALLKFLTKRFIDLLGEINNLVAVDDKQLIAVLTRLKATLKTLDTELNALAVYYKNYSSDNSGQLSDKSCDNVRLVKDQRALIAKQDLALTLRLKSLTV